MMRILCSVEVNTGLLEALAFRLTLCPPSWLPDLSRQQVRIHSMAGTFYVRGGKDGR